jgi:hypothetical protein
MDENIFDPKYQAIASVDNGLDALRAVKSHFHCNRSVSGILRGMFGACVEEERPVKVAKVSMQAAQVSVGEVQQPSSRRVSALTPPI